MRGGIVLLLAFIAPVLGWFLFLPFVLISGLGAMVSYFRRGRRVAPSPVETAAIAGTPA